MDSKVNLIDISILIPDGEHTLLIEVISCLAKHREIKIFVMSNDKSIPMRYSRYVNHFVYFKKSSEIKWIEQINTLVEKLNIDLILPISEEGYSRLINYKDLVENKEKLVYLTQAEHYKKAEDKAILAKHLLKFNIPHPKTVSFNPDIKNEFSLKEICFPVIAKPSKGVDGEGIRKFKLQSNLEKFLFEKVNQNYIVQEFIEGYDIDCSVLCRDGEVLISTIQKGTLFEKRKFAAAIGLQFLENDALLSVVNKLMKSLNWSGVAHIDLRYDVNSKNFKIIEINGRFWGSMYASCIAGVNFPHQYCLTAMQNITVKNTFKPVPYLNLKGLVATIKRKPSFIFNISFIKNNTPVTYLIKDPLPLFLRFFFRTKNLLKQYFSS